MRCLHGVGTVLPGSASFVTEWEKPCLAFPFRHGSPTPMQRHTPIRWNAYPALLLAGAFALGIWARVSLSWAPISAWLLLAAAALGLAVLGHAWPRRRLVTLRPLVITLALGGAAVALGGARTASFQHLAPGHIGTLLDPDADVNAVMLNVRVSGAVEETPRGARFTARIDTLVHGRDTLSVAGAARVFFRSSPWEPPTPFPAVRQGDRLRLRARLQALPRPRNPGDFDYGAYLRRRGIHAVATVDAADGATIVRRGRASVLSLIASLRTLITNRIDTYVQGAEGRAVMRALLTGNRGAISETTQDRFAKTGLLHLLAISGLHVLLVGMVIYVLMRPVLMRLRLTWQVVEWTRAVGTLALLVGFALLTGGRPSVSRAVVMAGLFIGGNVLQRSTHSLNTLGVAGLVLLAARPLALFDAGFQLSFAAVAAIITLNPRMQAWLPPRWRHTGWRGHVGSLVTVSVAATLGTMPVLLVHFGYVSFAGIALNVAAIPVTGLALLSGMMTALLGGWASLGGALGAAATVLTSSLLWIAETGDTWLGWMSFDRTVRNPWIIGALVMAMIAATQWPRPRLRWRLVAATLLLATVGTWLDARDHLAKPELQVVFFDVGQGDAALVSFPNGAHLLVDTGPRSPLFDAGASVIAPHLDRWGIEQLDAVAISHSDSDHLGGLPSLLRQVPTERVVLNELGERTDLVEEVERTADSLRVPIQQAWAGDTLSLDPAVHVQVLGPPRRAPFLADDNDASLVVRIVYGETQFLFTGDVERRAEQWLSHHYGVLLRSDVVKVAHHGSSTSSHPVFVREAAANGGTAVVSVGARNPFGLPAAAVLRRWSEAGTTLATTAADGAVWLRSDGKQVRRVRWR